MQVIYREMPNKKSQAGNMSDHHAHVYPAAGMVCQNLQGPYAIKKSPEGFWTFDLPNESKVPTVQYTSEYIAIKSILTLSTGMDIIDAERLLDAMIFDNKEKTRNKNAAIKIPPSNQTAAFLDSVRTKYPGIAEKLGTDEERFSIESDAKYKDRIDTQIAHLKKSLDPDAAVLMFQEQPYQLKKDHKRQKIFNTLMQSHGYKSVASLEGRDVGIWVQSQLFNSFKNPRDKELVSMIESSPFYGCVAQDLESLYINLHCYTVGINFDDYIAKLCELSNAVNQYAKNRKLRICLNGDLNLDRSSLTPQHKASLQNAGFILNPLKGQEPLQNPTYEGSINDEKYLSQRPLLTSPTSDYDQIKTHLKRAWDKVKTSFGDDASTVEFITEKRLPNFLNYQQIQNSLSHPNTILNQDSVKKLYQQIHQILETKTARYMTSPKLHHALIQFEKQVTSACAATMPPDNNTHAILEGILSEFKIFMSHRTNKHTQKDKHTGLDEIHNALTKIDPAKNPYQNTLGSLMIIADISRDRLNHQLNFFHQMTRNSDVAEIYALFKNNSLFILDNNQLKYNTEGLEKILIKLETLNRHFDKTSTTDNRQRLTN